MNDLDSIIENIANTVAAKAAAQAAQHVLAKRPIFQRYLSTKEVSQYLGLSVDVLQLWRAQEQGPEYIRINRSVRYDVMVLDDWMAGNLPGLNGSWVSGHVKNGVVNQHKEAR